MLRRLQHFLARKETRLFAWSFAVRLAVFAALWWWFRALGHSPELGSAFPVAGGDSQDYYILSQNLFHYGVFSSSSSFPLIPESFRLPGYPFFLYLFDFLPHPLLLASLAQAALGALSVVLIYLIGKRFLSEKVALAGALLFSLEPTSLFWGTTVMSDPLFVFALLLGVYLLLKTPPNASRAWGTIAAAGIVMGFAVLVRVIAEYYALCLLFAWCVIYRDALRPYIRSILHAALFLVCMGLVVAPWMLRNHREFNTYTISSTPYINVTQYNLVYFYAYQHHTTPPAVQHIFSDPIPYPVESYWFRSLINEPIFKQEIADTLRGNLIPYLKFHLVKTVPFFLNDGLRDINRNVQIIPQAPLVNFTDLLLTRDFGGIIRYVTTPQPELSLMLAGTLAWALITLLWLFAAAKAVILREKKLWFILFASGTIAYFAVLSSPVIQPRYRMPAAPFMLLMAAEGAAGLYALLSRRSGTSVSSKG